MRPSDMLFIGLWFFAAGCGAGILWSTRPWKRRHRITAGGEGILDPRTAAALEAVKDLPLGEAEMVLFHIARLVGATETIAQLWPDAERLGALAAVTRAAQARATPAPRPQLVPPRGPAQ